MSTDADLLARAREIDLLASLRTNNKGLIEASLSNLIAMLSAETRWRLSYSRAAGLLIETAPPDRFLRVTDADMTVMRMTLERECGFAPIRKGNFRDALLYVAKGGTL